MDEKQKLGLVALGALIVGGLTTAVIKGDGSDPKDVPTTLEAVPSGVVQKPTIEVPAPEPVGPLTTDLDSPLVPPGERVVSEVNLPDGWAPIGELTPTGDGAACFKIVASQMVGHTLKVMAESACATPVKFTATFQYDKAR